MALGLLFSIAQGPAGFVASLQGMIIGAGILYLVGSIGGFLAGREAMGGGDVAMMAMVGAFLGWESVCVTIFLGSCIGVLLHLAALALAKRATGPSAPSPEAASALEAVSPPDVAPPRVPQGDAEFKTAEQLKSEGYLPFGVSLAIAAGLLLVTGARWPIVGWVATYARFLGL